MNIIKVENINVYYGKSHILKNVSLDIKHGEIVSILGRNGAGKTTLLKSIMGLVKPKEGNIFFKNENIIGLPAFKIARKGIGYVPQGRQLFPKMTVLENLKTGIRDKTKINFDEIFDIFPFLKERIDQIAGTLSGGQQQALAIARALIGKPEVLMLDEPTTGLMPIFVNKLKDIIKMLNKNGITILLVEEKVPFAITLANYIYFMVNGKIEHLTKNEEVQKEKNVFINYLGVKI